MGACDPRPDNVQVRTRVVAKAKMLAALPGSFFFRVVVRELRGLEFTVLVCVSLLSIKMHTCVSGDLFERATFLSQCIHMYLSAFPVKRFGLQALPMFFKNR